MKTSEGFRIIVLFLLIILTPSIGCRNSEPPRPNSQDVSFQEKLLATIPDDFRISAEWHVFPPSFSPDGAHVAYKAATYNPKAWFIMLDTAKVSENLGYVGNPAFGANGIVYTGMKDGKQFIAIGGKKIGLEFERIYNFVLSPDGKRLAYKAMSEGKQVVVVDGKKGRGYDEVSLCESAFSLDGNRLAYIAKKGKDRYIVVDGAESTAFMWVMCPFFSPDSRTVAHMARTGKDFKDSKDFIVLGGKKIIGDYDNVLDPVFSTDGKRVAYVAIKDKKWFVVIDGKSISPQFDDINEYPLQPLSSLTWIPGGKDLVYVARRKGEQSFIVSSGKQISQGFDSIDRLVFSPKGDRLAFVGAIDRNKRGGNDSGASKAVLGEIEPTGYVVVAGESRSEEFDYIGRPIFHSNGKKVAFGARKGRELWWKVMDVK